MVNDVNIKSLMQIIPLIMYPLQIVRSLFAAFMKNVKVSLQRFEIVHKNRALRKQTNKFLQI